MVRSEPTLRASRPVRRGAVDATNVALERPKECPVSCAVQIDVRVGAGGHEIGARSKDKRGDGSFVPGELPNLTLLAQIPHLDNLVGASSREPFGIGTCSRYGADGRNVRWKSENGL